MKLKALLIATLLISTTVKAQKYFGIHAGGGISNIVTKINGKKDEAIKGAAGYIVAADVNIPVSDNLLLQTGLQYQKVRNQVNTNSTSTVGGTTFKRDFSGGSYLSYINIPLKLLYKQQAGSGSITIGAGPYLGLGIAGRSKSTDITETTAGGTTTRNVYDYNRKVSFGTADTTIKRINTGLGVNIGYTLSNNCNFSLYSNIGMGNINNQYNTKTFAAGITIGYIFAKKD